MNTLGLILSGLFLLTIVLVEIYRSPKIVAELKRRIAAGDMDARTQFYKKTALSSWSITVIAMAIMICGGLSLATIGFDSPEKLGSEFTRSVLIGAIVGVAIVTIVLHRQQNDDEKQAIVGDIEFLIPRTTTERKWWAVVAITAGITEEIYFRALPILFFAGLIGGDSLWLPVVLSAIVFGLGHTYQGIKGVIGTTIIGLTLGAIYAYTGSLLPGMLLHVLIDLRILLVRLPETAISQPSDDENVLDSAQPANEEQ